MQNLFSQASYEHYKPEDFNRQGGGSESQSEASDAEDGGNLIGDRDAFGERKKVNVLDYAKYFSKASLEHYYRGSVTDEHYSNTQLARLPPGLEHEIDFKQYHQKSVYHGFACHH